MNLTLPTLPSYCLVYFFTKNLKVTQQQNIESVVVSSADTQKGSTVDLTACNKCHMCKQSFFNTNSTFKSFVTGRTFSISNKMSSPQILNCKTKNVVYLISCTKCSLQYVGMTTQQLNTRFSQHRHNILQRNLNTFLVNHFNQADHHYKHLSIQIIDHIEDNIEDI